MVQTLDTKDLTCNEKEAKKSDRMPDNRKVEKWKKGNFTTNRRKLVTQKIKLYCIIRSKPTTLKNRLIRM